jgi:cold shock CspA family protein
MHYVGTCYSWNSTRAFGFITSDVPIEGITDPQIFVHKNNLPKGVLALEHGVKVEFKPIPPRMVGRQPEARIIRILSEAEAA